jgi:uncharacterized protein YcaQ
MRISTPPKLSLRTARTLAVVKQGLHRRPPIADKETLLGAIRRIGLLQLDTISVVDRSHYLVMLSRVGPYKPADLDALLYPDRQLFEQWAHAACLIPVGDYPYIAPTIHARRDRPISKYRLSRLGDDPEALLQAVLAEVRARGPLASRDFEDPREERGSWWDWKPAKTALEILFAEGHLLIDRRAGFQRYYDLAERVLPASAQPPALTLEDWQRWAAFQSVSRFGVATAAHAADYYRQTKPSARSALQSLATEGSVVPVEVEGWKDIAYLNPADLALVDEIQSGGLQSEVTTFLSPFDNLIWERDRVRELFGFDYRIEMYTPAAQRSYGYYVMPILHRGRLIGRMDPKADRKAKKLIVNAIYLEPGEPVTEELTLAIATALREFMAFHGSEALRLERSKPEALGVSLRSLVESVD